MTLNWIDLNKIKDAIADVRSDKTSTNWALIAYQGENSNDVALVGTGEGGVNELISHLQDNIVAHGLVRVTERFDNSDTVKFVYINWVGEKIHRMLRARLGTHSGAIKEIVSPYHVNVDATNHSEISEEIVTKTISKASGTAVHVLSGTQRSGGSPSTFSPSASKGSPSTKGVSSVPKSTDNVKFGDEGEIKRAIQDVRSDATPTNWVLLTYDASNANTIVLSGTGTGGSEELISHLKEDNIGYGLIRQEEKYDDTNRVMFAFVNWAGEGIPRMQKARIGTHSGAVKGLLAPYHADVDASNHSEISPEKITSTIRLTMGTKTRVLH